MLRKLIVGAGMAYMANKFMGRRRGIRAGYPRSGSGLGLGLGGSRWGRRGMSW